MHFEIKKRHKKLDKINQLRIERALSGMPESFCQVYAALPLLLHLNHPSLPGFYSDDTPSGVAAFDAKNVIYPLPFGIPDDMESLSRGEKAISGIFSMGSTSSIGQTRYSDLDIWICLEPWVNGEQQEKLKEKCDRISHWANALGIDVSLFLIEQNRFRYNQSKSLDQHDCGSSLNILLLDEFYRSEVRLAGKPVLWGIIPTECSNDSQRYDEYIQHLVQHNLINLSEWIDFGPLTALSAEEYFGASLWQLYKSIDSPYKSVLKALLLEAYSSQYPNTQLLAIEMKQSFFDNEYDYSWDTEDYHYDAYFLMLERVTHYLESIKDYARLDLARRSFYMKVREKLSWPMGSFTWRRKALQELVKEWGWDQLKIEKLDSRKTWKIADAREVHEEQLDAMMATYRNLINFGRRHNLNSVISPQDITILTRRLYAMFEVLPGKITLINPVICPDLSEFSLTFIHVDEERVNRAGWYLYNKAPSINEIVSNQPIEYSGYLSKLVAWSYFNGLLTNKTKLYVKTENDCDVGKLKRFVGDIAQFFSRTQPSLTKEALYHPCEIRRLAIIVNLDNDPTTKITVDESGIEPLSVDVFSYGEEQTSLVGSIDLLYRNSWNEVRTLRFEQPLCILDALKTILGKMHKGAEQPEEIKVFGYCKQINDVIVRRVDRLVKQCVELRLSVAKTNSSRFKPVHIAGQTWGLFFEHLGVTAYQFDNSVDFYGAISNNKLQGTALNFTQVPDDLPEVIYGFASEGIIQFFFEDAERGFHVYILNEHNQVEIYRHCNGTMDNMVQDVHRFYALSQERTSFGSNSVNFNLPQFYQLVEVNGRQQVLPFFSKESSVSRSKQQDAQFE